MIKAIWDCKSAHNFTVDFDCYIAESLLAEGKSIGTQGETLKRYSVTSLEDLALKQKTALQTKPKLEALFYEIEMPLAKVLFAMEQKGILLDTKQLDKVGKNIDRFVLEVTGKIQQETKGDININSPAQLGSFLVEKIGIPLGRTKTGKYATNESELSQFKTQFPIIKLLLSYRELTKLRSTYVESLIQKVDRENRIHTTYNQVYVNTGRLASSNPNLQNIPVSSPIGREIKSCFIASPGFQLVSFDYSQQELRILAHLAGEQALITAFENKRDVHKVTASKLFQVPYDAVSHEQRAVGKTINFGIIYGMSSYGMSSGLHIPQEDAEQFIKQFYLSYPKIQQYYEKYLKNARIHGFAETMLGRRRFVFEDPRSRIITNSMRRVLMNFPIQGTAAELMKKSMVDVHEKILKKYPQVSLLLTIHDDLVFEMPENEKSRDIIAAIQALLCTDYQLLVPLAVDIKIGKRWGDLHPYQ